jgi:hypothetical protein
MLPNRRIYFGKKGFEFLEIVGGSFSLPFLTSSRTRRKRREENTLTP